MTGFAPVARPANPVGIDSATLPIDPPVRRRDLTRLASKRTSEPRDAMFAAIVGLFTWLDGGVHALVVTAGSAGIRLPDYRIVDAKTLVASIGATVAQAGIAFVAITRRLFSRCQERHRSVIPGGLLRHGR